MLLGVSPHLDSGRLAQLVAPVLVNKSLVEVHVSQWTALVVWVPFDAQELSHDDDDNDDEFASERFSSLGAFFFSSIGARAEARTSRTM